MKTQVFKLPTRSDSLIKSTITNGFSFNLHPPLSCTGSKLGAGLVYPIPILNRNWIEAQSKLSGCRMRLLSDYAGKIDQNSQHTPSEHCPNSLRF